MLEAIRLLFLSHDIQNRRAVSLDAGACHARDQLQYLVDLAEDLRIGVRHSQIAAQPLKFEDRLGKRRIEWEVGDVQHHIHGLYRIWAC